MKDLKRRMDGAIAASSGHRGLAHGPRIGHVLDPIMVEAYGSRVPLNQVANVTVPEPRMLSVSVWDKSMVGAVERAIRESNLGLNPMSTVRTCAFRCPSSTRSAARNWSRSRTTMPRMRAWPLATCAATAWTAEEAREGRRHQPGRQPRTVGQGPEAHRRDDSADRPLARRKGKGNHAGLGCRSDCIAPGNCRQPCMDCEPLSIPRHVAIIMDGNGRWARSGDCRAPLATSGCRGRARDGARRRRTRHRSI